MRVRVVLKRSSLTDTGRRRKRGRWQRTVESSEAGEALLEMCDLLRLPERIIDQLQCTMTGQEVWGYSYTIEEL